MTTRHDLIIRQGETWSFTWTKKDSAGVAIDITGYTARMAIRDTLAGPLEAYLSSGTDADGGSITLGGAAGTVVLAMTATQSAALAGEVSLASLLEGRGKTTPSISFLYDLELVSGAGVVTRELEGRVQVLRQVTT